MLRDVLKKHIPVKHKMNYRRQFLKWFSKQLIDQWKAKEKAKRKCNSSKDNHDYNEFKRLRVSPKNNIREGYNRFVNRATLKENEDYNEFKRLGLLLKKHYSNPINYEL